MRLINKNNFLTIICYCFTILTLFIVCTEGFLDHFNSTHFNILSAFFLCCLGTVILSQHTRFENLPPIVAIIIEYVIGLICVILYTYFTTLHPPYPPHPYRDMIRSFSIPYFILAILYYIQLYNETKKQNLELKRLQELKQSTSCPSDKEV